ncbi:Lrp/AsnC ligand binding domain-containing protein [Serratia marcescens]|nr:Lrp/AsnC ligand binding domain-containing protein [Serratia marcescens]QXX96966.1 Lrp/AsnC ligand binding domain-containing protein [Serratia marcescens]HBC5198996.1 Lrp/AsnC ligand binding domain-containing protein [Serratia marcescens]HBK4794363.1 Lrp/AsnC ligand binding domain-containing protein [Serratia marcescens]HEB0103611.1 Lrp/AsnC ligand binding domain-containing protein [Serratia marcescens]
MSGTDESRLQPYLPRNAGNFRVVSRDLKSFQLLYDERLSEMPGVQRLNTTLVMKTVVQDRPLPLHTDPAG